MSIKTILRTEFDRLRPLHSALESLMGEQVEWFSSGSGNLLGIVAKGKGEASWNYAILKRDRKGDFHVRKVMSNFFTMEDAGIDLRLSMAEFEKADRANRESAIFGLPLIPAKLLVLNQAR